MNKNLLITPWFALIIIFLSSCVKDTDFSQAENVTLTPVVELNLIHFDINASEFFDPTTGTPRLTVVDTTEIRFLDDSGFQESLQRAEFFFRFENSIPRSFQTDFLFLDKDGIQTYGTSFAVAEGSNDTPVVTEHTENVEGEAVLELTSADRVVVSVTIPSANANLTGNLNLQSKTTYYLEIKERD